MSCPHKDAARDCQWMKLTEVSKYLSVDRTVLYKLIRRKDNPLPARKIGGWVYRVCLEMLKDWIEETNDPQD